MLIENDRDLDPLLNDVLPKDESELKQFNKEVKELRQYFKDSLIEEQKQKIEEDIKSNRQRGAPS